MQTKLLIVLIIIVGLIPRLFLSSLHLFNFDMEQFARDIEIFRGNGNIYLEQKHYNYTPFWYLTLGFLDSIPFAQSIPYYFLIRGFLSLIDVATFFVLMMLAKKRGLPIIKTGSLFFLNPVSIILTGYHGQFDNIAVLLLLLAIYFYHIDFKHLDKTKQIVVWMTSTASLIVKHIVLFPLTFFWFSIVRSRVKAGAILFLSAIIFLLMFAPYASGAKRTILQQVFLYRSVEGRYGLGSIVTGLCPTNCALFQGEYFGRNVVLGIPQLYFLTFLLVFVVLLFTIRFSDPARAALFGTLFFLTFTNGIGAQYLILPVALGVLFPSKWFLLYSIMTSLFVLGNGDELGIRAFEIFSWMIPWSFVSLWFMSELMIVSPKVRKYYDYVMR